MSVEGNEVGHGEENVVVCAPGRVGQIRIGQWHVSQPIAIFADVRRSRGAVVQSEWPVGMVLVFLVVLLPHSAPVCFRLSFVRIKTSTPGLALGKWG